VILVHELLLFRIGISARSQVLVPIMGINLLGFVPSWYSPIVSPDSGVVF